jgi:acyl-ACP thioesterase
VPSSIRFEVRSGDAGPHGRLGLPALCTFLQEAARVDAAVMGAGVDALAEQGQVWMMNRLRLELAAEPVVGETLEVTTWPTRWDRVAAERDFDVRTLGGAPVALATSRWMIVDFASRRIVRLPAAVRALQLPPLPRALAFEGEELHRVTRPEGERRFTVRPGDLDAARHVNCARHVEWALASLPADALAARRPARFEIAFRRESVEGETVVSRAERHEAEEGVWRWAHQLVREADGAEVAQAASEWAAIEGAGAVVGSGRFRRADASSLAGDPVPSHGETR